MTGFIYIIRNNVNNKIYIGQTRTSLKQRWNEHVRKSKTGNYVINRAIRKYGVENFSINILEECLIENIDQREIYYIEKYNSTNKLIGYNVSIGGKTPKLIKKNINKELILNLYTRLFFTLSQIARLNNISRYEVRNILTLEKVKIRTKDRNKIWYTRVSADILLNAIKKAQSLRGAAKEIKVSYSAFRKACIYNHIEYNSPKSIRHLQL